jgi:hypothetical protein
VDTTRISEAEFACAVCREPAGRVRLLPTGEPLADRSSDALEALSELDQTMRPAETAAIVVEWFCGVDHLPISADLIDSVTAAVAAADATALYALAYSYAPFHCPDCAASYCGRHWSWRDFDDGTFSGVEGNCPRGHFHVLRY